MKCPVCNTQCSENTRECVQCHWEFEIYISGIGAQTKNAYHQRLKIAQEKWNNRILLKEKKNEKNIAKESKPRPTPQKKTNDYLYSENTTVPELSRDPFETVDEYSIRINNYPPIPAGKVQFIKNDFSIHFGEIPIELNFEKWTQDVIDMPLKNQSFCINVSPDIAKKSYQSIESPTLFIKLKLTDDHIVLDRMDLFWNDQIFPIRQCTGISELMKTETETDSDYTDRILNYNDLPAGEGTLIKDQYDIATGIFPLKLKIDQWFNDNFNISENNPHIIAERDIARDIYEQSHEYPVKAKLRVSGKDILIDNFYLYANNKTFLIENMQTESLISTKGFIEPVTQMEFNYVPGGTFQMGDIFGNGENNEKPVHDVKLDSFYIGKYPVTNRQWQLIMQRSSFMGFQNKLNHPVADVLGRYVQKFNV